MKIFEKDGKINFIDENDVYVGFCNSQNCCEDFGYTLKDDRGEIDEGLIEDLTFDPEYFEYLDRTNAEESWDEGGEVQFKLLGRPTDVF